MAHYLQSLVRVIELILSHEKQLKYFNRKTAHQLHSLLEKACSLRDAFANHATLSQQQDRFEDQIRDAAQNAEDVLETYVASFATNRSRLQHIKALSKKFVGTDSGSTQRGDLPRDMQMLHESFDSIKKEMMKILDADQTSADHTASLVVTSPRTDQNHENVVVGFTYDLLQLKDRVFGDSSKLEIVSIIGMGGIGKTTLARKLYDDSSIVSEFDTRAWATVSDDYSLRDILLGLLDKKRDEMAGVEDNVLGLTLYQSLVGRRYLIVLDDIWRSNAWDDVKKCFPNEDNGSCIIVTTRQSDVATYVDSSNLHHQVRPLSEDDSWKLLRKKVFGEEACLHGLEDLGRKIANSCRGLPLAIRVIGGLLSQTERTTSSWEQVSSNVISAIANEEEPVSHILDLSYNNLPYFLRPCFLYMSAFPEDFEIEASTLVRLWIAEGFLIPILGKSLEEVAVEHLNALISRNLIFVRVRTTTGEVDFLGIHDLIRELCVLKSRDKKFFYVVNGRTDHNASQDISCMRRVNVLTPSLDEDIYGSTRQKQLARSLLSFKLLGAEPKILPHDFSTLRLLSGFNMENSKAAAQPINLRYFSLGRGMKLDPRITTFRNLQFLIINSATSVELPHELFQMPQLREITSMHAVLYCDFNGTSARKLVLQENLHTLRSIKITANIDVVLEKFPNLKRLGLHYHFHRSDMRTSFVFPYLRKIETLEIFGRGGPMAKFLLYCSFSYTLNKLFLLDLTLPKSFMTELGMLPNLELFILKAIRLQDDTHDTWEWNWSWKLSEGKFCKLKYLTLSNLGLANWEADETHFPILEQLSIISCDQLRELPLAIGEIPTLKTIKVVKSSVAANAWARQIEEEQLDYGNDLLQVIVSDISAKNIYGVR